jgi:hypothetical protein
LYNTFHNTLRINILPFQVNVGNVPPSWSFSAPRHDVRLVIYYINPHGKPSNDVIMFSFQSPF